MGGKQEGVVLRPPHDSAQQSIPSALDTQQKSIPSAIEVTQQKSIPSAIKMHATQQKSIPSAIEVTADAEVADATNLRTAESAKLAGEQEQTKTSTAPRSEMVNLRADTEGGGADELGAAGKSTPDFADTESDAEAYERMLNVAEAAMSSGGASGEDGSSSSFLSSSASSLLNSFLQAGKNKWRFFTYGYHARNKHDGSTALEVGAGGGKTGNEIADDDSALEGKFEDLQQDVDLVREKYGQDYLQWRLEKDYLQKNIGDITDLGKLLGLREVPAEVASAGGAAPAASSSLDINKKEQVQGRGDNFEYVYGEKHVCFSHLHCM